MEKEKQVRAAPQDDEIDLRELVGVVYDRRWWVIATTAIFAVLSVAYVLLAAPVYQAQAMIQVESKVPAIPGLSDLTSLTGGGSAAATTEVALLTSRMVVGAAVDRLQLDIDAQPRRFPLLGGYLARRHERRDAQQVAGPALGLSRYGWGGEVLSVHRLDVPDGLLNEPLTLVAGPDAGGFSLLGPGGDEVLQGAVGVPAQAGGIKLEVAELRANPGTRFSLQKRRRLDVLVELQKEIKVAEQGKDSGILKLAYEGPDALGAEALLQNVAEIYVRQNVERSSAEAASQLQFVKDQLPTVRRQVESAQAAMAAYQSRSNAVDITLQTKGLLEQQVAVETSIQQLQLKQAEMDRTFTREHPAYRALLKQIGGLQARKDGFRNEVSDLPDTQQELLRFTRDLTVSNELYTALLNQAQQLDVARAGTVGNVRIVDSAVADMSNPVAPKKAVIVLAMTLLGGLLSVACVFVLRMLNPGIEDPADIEELGLPVYAAIPLSGSASVAQARKVGRGKRKGADAAASLLASTAPADLAVEALRSLRTSLHFAMMEAKNNILVVSGPRPGIGKTFIAANLAAVIAQAGQKVIVVDADMRRGTLHKVLGAAHSAGLSDVLAGKVELNAAISTAPGVDGMHYIGRGEVPPSPSELLMHPRFAQILEELERTYDLVIIDTPPVLAVTDAVIVAKHAGSTLMVTRFGVNHPKEIRLAMKRFEQNGVQVKGAIFNAVEKRKTGYHSYGYYEYASDMP